MSRLEAALDWVRALDPEPIAGRIRDIGFECTRCGRCCRATDGEPHTATVFPDEIREIQETTDGDWDEIARPMPYGVTEDSGETFEWALQTDSDGDCTFLETVDGHTRCSIYGNRPLVCRTYPFSLSLPGTGISAESAVATSGRVRASECPGLGAEISNERALAIAETLLERAKTDIRETISLREAYTPQPKRDSVIVHDSEGPKHPDGRPLGSSQGDNY